MTFYSDMSISDFLDYASASSDEMASLGNGRMVDYETGKHFDVKDEETAVFVASARNMVEELCKRLRDKVQETAPLHAEIERLQAENAKLKAQIQSAKEMFPFLAESESDDEV